MKKAKIKFSKLSVPKKIETARTIVTDTTGNGNFPICQALLPPITNAVNDLETKFEAAAGGDHQKKALMHAAAKVLDGLISFLEDQINVEAGGDEAKIKSTGCDVRKQTKRGKRLPGIKQGKRSGEIILFALTVKGAAYRFQLCSDPPPNETTPISRTVQPPVPAPVPAPQNQWSDAGTTKGATFTATDLTSGSKMWGRVAVILTKKKGGQQGWVLLGAVIVP
ncbi:MAG: hypothetical protein HY063_02510 [Bacteroidetes bacterium]|nr:hypothetical protein [Bacteroidota bacterium]